MKRSPQSRQSDHTFSRIPAANIPRSVFNRDHGVKTTFNAGKLVPIFVDEVLPGDTVNLSFTGFCRMATPLAPLMDNLYMDVHYFSVPMRLIWDNWQAFNGEDAEAPFTTEYLTPIFDEATLDVGEKETLDYMGMPVGYADAGGTIEVQSAFCRAYNLIWNEWYRDQNLQDKVTVDKGDGPDDYDDYSALLPRGKRHDYFTSCLPWPQKGDAVTIGLTGTGEVWGSGTLAGLTSNEQVKSPLFGMRLDRTTDGYYWAAMAGPTMTAGAAPVTTKAPLGGYLDGGATWGGTTGSGNNVTANYQAVFLNKADSQTLRAAAEAPFTADLSGTSGVSINALREAFQIQRLLERDARGGTRYTEILRAHFGVVSPDGRLQRPEFLGGGTTPITTTPVPQTGVPDANNPIGQLGAFVTGVSRNGFVASFTEHCIVIGLASVRADLSYQQGIPKMFSRRTRYDYYWPALAHLGEQAVLSKEIYADGTANDENVFGYQERWAEYRYKPSLITGGMRSVAVASYDIWHLAQDFSARPTLDSTFIVENPPMDRVIAVTAEDVDQFLLDGAFRIRHVRPMPVYSVPGLIDHF